MFGKNHLKENIILGQSISYYIYIWNLKVKGIWKYIPKLGKLVIYFIPLVAIIFIIEDVNTFIDHFFRNEKVPFSLLAWGSAGQIIFTLRFVYQFYYSYNKHESLLPINFWIISLIGNIIIISYGVFREDPVLIIGQSVGFITYTRNIMISFKSKKKSVVADIKQEHEDKNQEQEDNRL